MAIHKSFGEVIKSVAAYIIVGLLKYKENEFDTERLPIEVIWRENHQLSVKTTIRDLSLLIKLMKPGLKITSEQIKNALHRLEDIDILKDRRIRSKGSAEWMFDLLLWSSKQSINLSTFNKEWDSRKPKSSNSLNYLQKNYAQSIIDQDHNLIKRPSVESEIITFIQNQSKGFINLYGKPGSGKTTLAISLAKQLNALYYSTAHVIGVNEVKHCLEQIVFQLIATYPFLRSAIAHTHDCNGVTLIELLNLLSQKQQMNEKTIIVLDPSFFSEELLFNSLPLALPSGIFILITSHQALCYYACYTPVLDIDLMSEKYKISRQEQEEMLKKRIDRHLENRLNLSSSVIEKWIDSTLLKSQDNLWVLDFAFKELLESKMQFQNSFSSLFRYFEIYCKYMRLSNKNESHTRLYVASVLAFSQIPLSLFSIAKIAKEDPLDVQKILIEWDTFLEVDYRKEEVVYSLYHNGFKDFLAQKQMIKIAYLLLTKPISPDPNINPGQC